MSRLNLDEAIARLKKINGKINLYEFCRLGHRPPKPETPEKPPVKPPGYPNWTGESGDPSLYRYRTKEGRVGISGINWDYVNNNLNGILPDPLVMSTVSPDGSPVTFIASNAFEDQQLAITVAIPSPIQHIEAFAFANCGIKNLVLNDSILTIGATEDDYSSFLGNRIEVLHMPPKLRSLGRAAFSSNNIHKIVWYGNDIIRISEDAFQYNNLSELDIPDSVETIGDNAYASNAITSIVDFKNVKVIQVNAFNRNSIEKLLLSNKVETLEWGSFAQNPILSLGIGDNVKVIEGASFSDDINPIVYANLLGDDYENDDEFRIRGFVFRKDRGWTLKPLKEFK